MFHNHHGDTRPDEKMSREARLLTSVQNKIYKRRAAKKRRQRDKT